MTDSITDKTLEPPYNNTLAVEELAGLEEQGYAIINSGTDVQIETLIPTPPEEDFQTSSTTNYTTQAEHFDPCTYWWTDDEGGGVGTWGSSEYGWNGGEAYQYAQVINGSSGSYTINIDSQGPDGPTSGYYCVLYNSGGSELDSGFTPCSFSVGSTGTYQVEADSYGSCYFDDWSGGGITGSTEIQPISQSAETRR